MDKNTGNRELLFSVTRKDFEIQTFRSGGKGGQNQNKVESGVRIIHKESGARGEARDSRDQLTNKRKAFDRLIKSKKFQSWFKIEQARQLMGAREYEKIIQQRVEEWMKPENLKIDEY